MSFRSALLMVVQVQRHNTGTAKQLQRGRRRQPRDASVKFIRHYAYSQEHLRNRPWSTKHVTRRRLLRISRTALGPFFHLFSEWIPIKLWKFSGGLLPHGLQFRVGICRSKQSNTSPASGIRNKCATGTIFHDEPIQL